MKNKQTFLIVLSLAVVASIFTFVAKSRLPYFGHRSMMIEPDSLAGSNRMGESMDYVLEDENYRGEMMDGQNVSGFNGEKTLIADSLTIMPSSESMPRMIPPYYGDDALNVEDRVYQNSSYHSVVVDDVSDYLRGIKEYVISIEGRVLNSSINASDKYDSGSLYVKVPVAKFDEATARVTENVEKIANENISASDVTGQLVNTTESLQNLKDAKVLKEAALIDAKTEVEKRRYQIEIDRLARQITAAEKNVDRVEAKVTYSTISITAADSERYFNPGADLSIREEFVKAWKSLKAVVKAGGYFGIWVLVYSVVWLPVVLVGKKIVGAFKKD